MLRLCVIAGLALLVPGCGNTKASDLADAQPEEIPASNYCEAIAPSFCSFYLRCGRMHVASETECRENFVESCNANFEGAYVELEALGYMSVSPAGLVACEAHLEEVACEQQVFELSGPCAGIWQGHQSSGASCGLDVEFFVCNEDSDCVLGLDFCGTCKPRIALGETCTPGETSCGAEAFCLDTLCVARKRNGEGCAEGDRCMAGSSCIEGQCTGPSFVAIGESCDRDHRCPYMTECIAGSCRASARLGESCDAMKACATGYCDGVCKTPQSQGASCSSPGQCSSGLCVDSLCQARPSACLE